MWYERVEAKVAYAPPKPYINEKGEKKLRFFRIGIKITLQDGCVWFNTFERKKEIKNDKGEMETVITRQPSWTRTLPKKTRTYKNGLPILDRKGVKQYFPPEKESMGGDKKLRESFGHCPKLLESLFEGRVVAIAEEKAKRAA